MMALTSSIKPDHPLPSQLLEWIPYPFAKSYRIIPIRIERKKLHVATEDLTNTKGFEIIRWITGCSIEAHQITEEEFERHLQDIYLLKKQAANLEQHSGLLESDNEAIDLISHDEEDNFLRAINLLISEAIEHGASDIHFEPQEDGLSVRIRVDGTLQPVAVPFRYEAQKVVSRIKILAKLDVAQKRLPQDGRIAFLLGGKKVDARLSTIPISHGERVVLRLLDKKSLLLNLDDLGLQNEDLVKLQRLLSFPEGMILVTGPTGSGKTTTLYSFLHHLKSSQTNIMTIEDPVEYRFHGISQTNVNHEINFSFSRGLRHLLRQDPDVLMIGEIRDKETSLIATQAALTGHLVLSTLHTNDAPSTITRLTNMGVEPLLINSTLLAVISQRLVRTYCTSCKGKATGCLDCYETGYKGRKALFEIFYMNDEIRRGVTQGASSYELKKLARQCGMRTLQESGQMLVEQGITSRKELSRVAAEV